MAVRSVLEVDIDPEDRLGKYVKKFKEYEAALKKTPEVWKKTGGEAEKATTAFESGLAALLAMIDAAQQLNDRQDETKRKSADIGSSWKQASLWSAKFASNIKDATLSFAKWVSIGGIVSGLAGAGGLFGLDALANAVGAGRRSAQGLGLTYGQQRAFNVDLNRIVESPDTFLGGINEALLDVTKRRVLYAAGLTAGDIQGKNTFQVALETLQAVKRRISGIPDQALGTYGAALGYGQIGLDEKALRRLKVTPDSDLAQFIGQTIKDSATFGFDDATQKKWQRLSIALEQAKTKIESAFVTGLAPFAASLPALSSAVAKTISTFLLSDDFKKDVAAVDRGLHGLAAYLGGSDFQRDAKEFATTINILARKTVSALQWLHLIPDFDKNGNPIKERSPKMTGWRAVETLLNPFALSPTQNADAIRVLSGSIGNWRNTIRRDPYSAAAETQYGLPSGLLEKIYGAETNYGRSSLVSPAGAEGPFQFMPATARQYGLGNPFDLQTSTGAAGHHVRDLLTTFKGDLAKAVAAYNWGEGHVERDISEHGDQWQKFLPRETRDYLAEVLGPNNGRNSTVTHKVASDVKVNIKIHSPPGANPIVNASTVGSPQ